MLLNHFCPVISYGRVRKKRKATRIVVYGHSLWSAKPVAQRKVLKRERERETQKTRKISREAYVERARTLADN